LSGKAPYDRATSTHLQLLQLLEEDPVPLLERRVNLSEALGAVIHRAMAHEPSERYPNVAAFAAALSPFASGLA